MKIKHFKGIANTKFADCEAMAFLFDGSNENEVTEMLESLGASIECIKLRDDYPNDEWCEGKTLWYGIWNFDKNISWCTTYRLILKPGDWICYIPALNQSFLNVTENCMLPYTSMWKEE